MNSRPGFSRFLFFAIDAAITTVNFTLFMRFELGREVIGSLMNFFTVHLTPAANPVKVAESVNVVTSLSSEVLFLANKKKNQSTSLARALHFTCGYVGAFCYVSFRFA